MKRKQVLFVLVISFICFLLILQRLSRNSPLLIIQRLNLSDKPVDLTRLNYLVDYSGLLVFGRIKIENQGIEKYRGKNAYHLRGLMNTSVFVSYFSKISSEADSYIDQASLCPFEFSYALIKPGKPVEENKIFYNQKEHILESKEGLRQILPETQDFLSTFYYLQHQAFWPAKEFDLNMNTNQKNYRLYLRTAAQKRYSFKDQNLLVWVLKGDIRRQDKSPRHSMKLEVWILDTKPLKIPILIKAMTNIGPVRMHLVEAQ
jgi:hypothetical protein